MHTIKLFLGSLAIFAVLTFNACDNGANNNDANDTEHMDGTVEDSSNGGNYSPDERSDNRQGETPMDSNYGTTGSKFDAEGKPVTGNSDINSKKQQDATTGENSNTEKKKTGQ